ncbi:beta-fructofuranosidase, insoluble isoenzyme 3-like protein [Cinnamomum micranthum f. kanehirae]|uniref:Beta-fructofuranosidase, insoluble isoenzyme 3-like protein n=1 Tax=Cinnamomum micranthum f. kanehirae TaxID=337451 RepID=A0A3S3R902_9MAGN|nr:beta-fructofuranosidase, insoluble isoenzyme 3-like protein [Cinnamomum micranthum f. kanehirae]
MGLSNLGFSFWVIFFCSFSLSRDVVDASHQVFSHLQSVQASSVTHRYRTGYHFQPPKNWINDPNGPMYYNGIYHLFYQYNPKGAVWGNIVWAHSVSTDLINWTPLDPAIYPSKPFDINGCWSGSATILPGNIPAILYTGIDPSNRQVQNVAYPKNISDPMLREWIKPDYNPLMAPINGINSSSFRDPTTAWHGPDGHWRVIIGSKKRRRGMAILYRSKDFVHWMKAKHPLHSSKNTGMWECPDLYPVSISGRNGLDPSTNGKGIKHVLKVSLDDKKFEYYTIGQYTFQTDRYVPDDTSADNSTGLRYDYGKFYASKTFYDSGKNRRVLWGWMNESDSTISDINKGWAGIQCIPRQVWLDFNGRQLVQWPIKEVESLRQYKVQLQNRVLANGDLFEVKKITAAEADIMVDYQLGSLDKADTFDPTWTDPQVLCSQKGANVQGSIGPFGLLVMASSGLEEYSAVFFRIFKGQHKPVVLMCSDQSRSTLQPDVDKTTYGGFVDVDIEDGKLSLRSLIDHSVIESFGAMGRTCITARVYPTIAIGNEAHLYAFNLGTETVKITNLKAWSMRKAKIY